MAVFSRKLCLKQKQLLTYRQFDMLYNLSKSKTIFGKKFVILENRFSRKQAYKGLRAFLIPIFGISIVDNLQLSRFYLKSDLTVGKVPSLVWITRD